MVSTLLASFWLDLQQTASDIHCLALNVYHEARGESFNGQMAVAKVTINRKQHSWFPNSICQVVYQPKQFSWTFTRKDHTPRDMRAWELAVAVAVISLYDQDAVDITEGATFYHADYVTPSWADSDKLTPVGMIGSHIFYQWEGDWH